MCQEDGGGQDHRNAKLKEKTEWKRSTERQTKKQKQSLHGGI